MKFRKKPVVIEAMQLNGQTVKICEWLAAGGADYTTETHLSDGRLDVVLIKTLEGKMRADPTDWIIRGVNGEFYPCKPEIFEKTYEKVE